MRSHPPATALSVLPLTIKVMVPEDTHNVMSGVTPHDSPPTQRDESAVNYRSCLITPMSTDRPLFDTEHITDAVIVSLVVLFSVILGDVLFAWSAGTPAYLSMQDITARLPTALVAFGLTFCAQWARARGIAIKAILLGNPRRRDDENDS